MTVEDVGQRAALREPDEISALRRENAELRAEIELLRERLTEAEDLADRDPLTPVFNRRAFLRSILKTQAFAERYGWPSSLVYFDLDGLKAINDRFGHPAGDAALRAVAEQLSGNVRAFDTVGRLGGDEFAVLLVQTDGFQAEAKAASLAEAIAAQTLADLAPGVKLNVSWGVAELSAVIEAEAVIAQADAAMYAARARRRGALKP